MVLNKKLMCNINDKNLFVHLFNNIYLHLLILFNNILGSKNIFVKYCQKNLKVEVKIISLH